jgi:hypothetical protein
LSKSNKTCYLANSSFPSVGLSFETATGRYLIEGLVGDQLVADTDHSDHNGGVVHAAESGDSL